MKGSLNLKTGHQKSSKFKYTEKKRFLNKQASVTDGIVAGDLTYMKLN